MHFQFSSWLLQIVKVLNEGGPSVAETERVARQTARENEQLRTDLQAAESRLQELEQKVQITECRLKESEQKVKGTESHLKESEQRAKTLEATVKKLE